MIQPYNSKLKYKGSLKKDQIWIDMMKVSPEVADKLKDLFGPIASTLPRGVLVVEFYAYKGRLSWIKCNGKVIKFYYNITSSNKSGEWFLSLKGDNYSLDWVEIIPFDHLVKKVVIKYLLNKLCS